MALNVRPRFPEPIDKLHAVSCGGCAVAVASGIATPLRARSGLLAKEVVPSPPMPYESIASCLFSKAFKTIRRTSSRGGEIPCDTLRHTYYPWNYSSTERCKFGAYVKAPALLLHWLALRAFLPPETEMVKDVFSIPKGRVTTTPSRFGILLAAALTRLSNVRRRWDPSMVAQITGRHKTCWATLSRQLPDIDWLICAYQGLCRC
jgi:hypothetical protein